MRGVVSHIDLTVRDPELSFTLYDAVLRALGYELFGKDDRGYDWQLRSALGAHSISIVRASAGTADHNRYAPGLHHLAWAMESRAAIDDMHALLQRVGATVLDAPADYPQYNGGGGYYAVFFADRDGLKLECVFTPPLASTL